MLEVVNTLTPGNTYYISVDNNYSGYRGSFTLCLEDNNISYDFYEGAIDVSGYINSCSPDAAFSTYGMTADKNAASCWNTSPNYNVWFKFVATTPHMKITIDRGGSKGTIRRINAALWQADGTTEITCKRYINTDDDVVLEVVNTLTPGNTYYISVDNNYSGYRGSFTLCLEDNNISYDYYEGAIELTDINNYCSADAAYTTYGMTADKNAASCWNTSPNYNVWFKFTATTPFIDIDVKRGGSLGSIRRINVALWESDGVTQIACNRYINTDDNVSVGATTLTPGNTYFISVDNNYSGYRGSFTLCVNDEPDYDFYEGAITLTDLNNWCSSDAAYTTTGATGDKNAASCWNTSPNYNRWFKFTAISPNVTIQVQRGGSKGTIRRINLALWASDGTTELACSRYINSNDNVSISYSALTPGNTYYISVDNNYSGYRGSFTLCVNNIDQIYYSRASGTWNDPNTWSTTGIGGPPAADYPQTGDVVYIEGHYITLTTNESVAEVNFTANTNTTGLLINNSSLIVSGNFSATNPGNNIDLAFTLINSSLSVNNNMIFIRNGGNADISMSMSNSTLLVNNDMTISSGAGSGNNTFSVSTLSTLTVNNNLTLSNTGGPKTTITIDNSNTTVKENLIFSATTDNKVEISLTNAANLFLERDIVQGSPAYGILSSTGGSTVVYGSPNYLQTMASTAGSGTGDAISYENVTINNSRITTPQVTLGGPVTITGILTFIDGEVASTSTNLLTIAAGGSVTGASAASFVDGPIKKVGNTDFEFPVGDNNFWQPIAITNLTGDAATEFTAQYFEQTPPDNLNLKSPDPNGDLNNISGLEYWELSNTGTASQADITLYWKDQTRSDIDNGPDLQIAHYTGTEWENLGQSSINFADPGSITVTGVSSFSPFTFGSLSSSFNALPVELISFEAKTNLANIELNWATASEYNNDYFELEKSADAEDWQVIGQVSGQGSSQHITQYRFIDQFPFAGLQYYRLKQVDFDGSYTYSKTILAEHPGTDTPLFQVFPNPVTTNQIQIKALTFDKITDLQIIDLQGKGIKVIVKELNRGTYMADLSELPQGLYVTIIHTARGTYRTKLLKL